MRSPWDDLFDPHERDNAFAELTLSGDDGAAQLENRAGIIAHDPASFTFAFREARLGHYRVQYTKCAAYNRERPATLSGVNVVVTLVKEGRLILRQDGTTVRLTAGDLAIVFTDRPHSLAVLQQSSLVTVVAEEESLRARMSLPDRGLRVLAGPSLIASASRSFLLGMLRPSAFPLPPVERMRTIRAIDATVAGIISAADDGFEETEGLPAENYSMVCTYIASHFTSPRLTTAAVAAHFGVSTRSLQRWFVGAPLSVSETIQQYRLEYSVATLLDERFDPLSIEDVALRSGFADADHLRRAMSQVMSATPSEMRTVRREAGARERG